MSDYGKDINVPSEDIVYRQDVEDMLQNALPSRGMWEIEGDVVKNTICETVADLMMDLEKLPSADVQPVTFCKNCQWRADIKDVDTGEIYHTCGVLGFIIPDGFACNQGKRKGADNE